MRACLPLLLICFLAVGCVSQPPPALVAVAEVSPRELDVGDRLEVLGGGFPEGRRATLSLRGDLHRPGRRPLEDVEIVVAAESVADDRVQATVTEELQIEICGRGNEADHTTFRGELVVAFAPRTSGAPPVTGTLAGVVLDVHPPPPPPDVAAARDLEAQRFLQFLGLEVRALPGGLEVTSIRGGGRAASAGLASGDLLLSADGVSARAAADLVPSGRLRAMDLVVRRGRLETPLRLSVDVAGFRHVLPEGFALGGAIAAVAIALLLVLAGPVSRLTTRFERRVAVRVGREDSERLAKAASTARLGGALSRLTANLAFVGQGFVLAFAAFGGHFLTPSLDLPVGFAVVATSLVALELAAGGFTDGGRWSFRLGAKAAVRMLGIQVCAAMAIACVVLAAGGTSLADVVRRQGGAPWRWAAAESPLLALALVVLITSAAIVPRWSVPTPTRTQRAILGTAGFAHWLNALFIAGLGSALFLGGWRLPWVSATDPTFLLRALATLLFLAKAWLVLAIVLGLRWAAPQSVLVGRESYHRLRWMLPCVAFTFAALVSVELAPVPALPPALRDGVGIVTTALCVALAAGFVARVLLAARGRTIQLGVNPWL